MNKKDKNKKEIDKDLLDSGNVDSSTFKEDDVQSPFKTVINTYRSSKVSMIALVTFIIIALIMIIGPMFKPVDLSFSETSQQNVAPGRDMMKFPKELDGNVRDIGVGPTFSFGISNNGDTYVWGKTRITNVIDIKNMPKDMGKVEKIAVGRDHVLALNEEGKLFAWGSDRQNQAMIPVDVGMMRNIKYIEAGFQNSMVLTEDGDLYYFGNSTNNDYNEFHEYQGQLDQVAATNDAVMGLTKSGEVVYLGSQQNSYSNIPGDMGKVVEIATTASSMAAVNEDGQIFVWGNANRGERVIPEMDGKVVSLEAGRFHYVALTDTGNVYAWGDNTYNQSTVPSSVKDIDNIYIGSYQNYAVDKSGKIQTWGLDGYLLGSDELGRDIFVRLLNGGRMSMTIGAVAVIISTIIGIIVGGVSGYFGGHIDNILQRLSEMVSSLPFLPFAMILSALIGNSMPPKSRVYLIMVILGLLSWTGLQRLVRAQVLSVREQEYVIAARSVGVKETNIVFKHILPNVVSTIIVSATLSFASSMLTESTLSFLGFGVQAPIPTWGNMLNGASSSIVIQNYWWRWVFASLILSVCVICINLIGDGLRDAIDPKSQER